MIALSATFNGLREIEMKFDNFSQSLHANVRGALGAVGLILKAQIMKNLSGPSHSKGARNAIKGALRTGETRRQYFYVDQAPNNPFPGVGVTGHLRGSVHSDLDSDGWAVRVGPHAVYAAIHEFGGLAGRNHSAHIPARPYVWPAWIEKRGEIITMFNRLVFGGIA